MTLNCQRSRKKLSKRDESIIQFIEQYEELGYLPEAIFNSSYCLVGLQKGKKKSFQKKNLFLFSTQIVCQSRPLVFDKNKLNMDE